MTDPQIDRCHQEIERIKREGRESGDQHPAYLFVLGLNDWEMEKQLIEEKDGSGKVTQAA